MFDEQEIRKALRVLKPNNALFEIRMLGKGKKIISGYFRDADTAISEIKKVWDIGSYNIYLTLNTLNDACYARTQRDRLLSFNEATTSDNDIVGIDWLMVDLDPRRPKDTSSTDEQLMLAKKMANDVYTYMSRIGFEAPVVALSGNGVHLLYKVRLKADSKSKGLMETCLKVLNMLFSNDDIDVDLKTFNPARVCKLYGTTATKGANTPDRPHRMSRLIGEYHDDIKVTDRKYVEKLASMYPKQDAPKKYNSYNPGKFDLDDWLGRFGIGYTKTDFSGGDKYILRCCPFDSNHSGKDACLFRGKDGAIGFHCFHSSCADKTWHDVRLLFEPDAYEEKRQNMEKKMYGNFNRNAPKKAIVEKDGNPISYTLDDIFNLPQENETFIRTGTKEIDKKMRGLKKGYVSVVSGLRGSSKSTWLTGVILEAINSGNNVGCYSGELSARNFMRWMMLQAAGKSHVEPSAYEGYYNVPRKIQKQIAGWAGKRFWLYNNNYGNDFEALYEYIAKEIKNKSLDLYVIDNLMALNISSFGPNKWEAQTGFIWKIHELAQTSNCHIIVVCHPRKAMGMFLRADDIAGTADLGNAAENIFIIHRNNNDFKRLTAQMFGWKPDEYIYKGTNIIEIAKDRDGGTQDYFVPLYYETETKRLRNNDVENKIYGWDQDEEVFIDVNNLAETPFI